MRFRSFAAFGAFAIAACSDASIPTAVPTMQAAGGSSNLASESGTYLVAFRGKMDDDFANSVAKLGGNVLWAHSGVGLAAIEGISASAASTLAIRKDVAAFEPDAYTVIEEPNDATVEAAAAGSVESTSNPAGAFFFGRQWNMRAIHANEAWAAGKLGSASTRVGILDTGIGYTHLDLAGLVDLAASRSFLSAAENKRVTDTFGATTNLVADLHYHGTHVASTVSSNALAAAGVASKVKLVGLKVCAPGTPNVDPNKAFVASCPSSAVLGAVLYAADIGLDVINMSLGGAFNRRDASARGGDSPSFLAIINSVFNYAYHKGTAVVVSAGNSSFDMDHLGNGYVTYCDAPHVICVAATGPTSGGTAGPWPNTDAPAYYTNFGRSGITVAAPGGSGTIAIVSGKPPVVTPTFVYAACSKFTIVTGFTVCQTGTFVLGLQGTSMAAPHVTGLAAIIAGEVGHNPDAIRERLTGTADDLGGTGTDPFYGRGRINAAHAMGVSY